MINDTGSGGANYFSVEDATAGRTSFLIEAGARTNALYADDGGRIAIGKITLVFTTQMKVGNTPTVRLEQEGSSGFTAQNCVVAWNDADFFIRYSSEKNKSILRPYS